MTILFANFTTPRFRWWNWGLRVKSRSFSHGRFNEFVTARKLEPGDKVHAELYLWVRARELVSPLGLVEAQ